MANKQPLSPKDEAALTEVMRTVTEMYNVIEAFGDATAALLEHVSDTPFRSKAGTDIRDTKQMRALAVALGGACDLVEMMHALGATVAREDSA